MRVDSGYLIKDKRALYCCNFYIAMNSKTRYFIDFLHFLNLLYIAIAIPL